MICEIVNPSDPYTLETDNFVDAALAIALISNGSFGLRCEETGETSPVLFGWEDWFEEHSIDVGAWLNSEEKREKFADILDSVLWGDLNDRQEFMDSVTHVECKDKRKEIRNEYQEKHHSSLNNIGKRCYQLADKLRLKE